MQEKKQNFIDAFNALSTDRQADILKYYSVYSVQGIINQAKREAQDVIDYADSRDYGYGEVGYYINEHIKDFAEEVPELEKPYKRLINGFFDTLVDLK